MIDQKSTSSQDCSRARPPSEPCERVLTNEQRRKPLPCTQGPTVSHLAGDAVEYIFYKQAMRRQLGSCVVEFDLLLFSCLQVLASRLLEIPRTFIKKRMNDCVISER